MLSTDPERANLIEDLKPLVSKARRLAQHYYNKNDHYNDLEVAAQGLPFKRFPKEATTRWSSFYDHMTTQLYDDSALRAHQKVQKGLPPSLDDVESADIQHLCGVLMPFKASTKAIESGKTRCRAGFYRPTAQALSRQMDPETEVPLPEGAGLFGPQKTVKFIKPDELKPLATRVKAFLRRDVVNNFEKHLSRNEGKIFTGVCSYLDPRFKDLDFAETDEERKEIKKKAKAMLVVMVAELRDTSLMPRARTEAETAAAAKAQAALQAIDEAREAAEKVGDISLKDVAAMGLDLKALKTKADKDQGKGQGKTKGKKRKAAVTEATPTSSSAAKDEPKKDPDEVPGFSVKRMYKPKTPEPTATQVVVDMTQVLRKQWEDYNKIPEVDFDVDPAEWWSTQLANGLHVPYVALLARACLGVPGSSADLERAFSHAGETLTPKRARLSTKHACGTIFVHENIIKGNV